MKSCGGTKGKTYKTFNKTNVDLLFILTQDKEMFLIPKDAIKNKTTINITDTIRKYEVFI